MMTTFGNGKLAVDAAQRPAIQSEVDVVAAAAAAAAVDAAVDGAQRPAIQCQSDVVAVAVAVAAAAADIASVDAAVAVDAA